MLAAKAGISVLEKIAPKAVAALGKAGVAEMALLAGGVAEGLNLIVTPIVTPIADKAGKFVKDKIQEKAATKKQKLLEEKAAFLAQKAQEAQAEVAAEAETEAQTEEVKVEEKPKTSGKKNKK